MQLLAEELSNILEYQLYKDLMREVRTLEQDIVNFQNELRRNIQERQLKEYVDIGEEKLRDFYNMWEDKFAEFNQDSFQKIEALKQLHEE